MFEFLQNNIFIAVGFAITSGVLVRIAFSLVGQRWVRTYHHTVTFALLPVIALIITKVIAGKLSLVWLIPTGINQNLCAHFRRPMDMIFQG
jgi:hypothetical protein